MGRASSPDGTMSVLDHLDELRARLIRTVVVFAVAVAGCWAVSGPIVDFVLEPVRRHLPPGTDLVFIHLPEPFLLYVKASALGAVFLTAPYALFEIWGFVAPGLYRNEKRWVVPFLFFGTLCFAAGGAFGYYVATPIAAGWLVGLGQSFTPTITIRSAFGFESRVILAMATVFELPVLIFFLARIGVVTADFLWRHLRHALLAIAVLAAVVTPTGDLVTMSVFGGPMALLYLIGIGVAWLSQPRAPKEGD